MSFSQDEKQQIIIASGIFVIVELSILIYFLNFVELIIAGLLIFPLFALHELAHKYTAIRYGFPAKFYLDKNMALFSLFTSFLPLKIIAPGAVIWYGNPSSRIRANVSLMGPLVNIFLGGGLLLISTFFPPLWFLIILFVSKASFDIALFNLLPFSILDGNKVYRWNKEVFFVIFGFTALSWLFHPLGFFIGVNNAALFILGGENIDALFILGGLGAMLFSVIFAYTFVFQSIDFTTRRRDLRHYSPKTELFSPRIISPSKTKKKAQIEGLCSQCGTSVLLGFTCSYCGEYFCTDHRLPEKHDCFGLPYR
ncbi:MAG: AN1-type zinc finger domain-containing protein [Candidatus Hodarchaeales archaeon]|jgi:Zn-dependent protease